MPAESNCFEIQNKANCSEVCPKKKRIMISSNKSTENPLEIANYFNDYFSSVATNLLKNLPKSDINPSKYLCAYNPGSIYYYPYKPLWNQKYCGWYDY